MGDTNVLWIGCILIILAGAGFFAYQSFQTVETYDVSPITAIAPMSDHMGTMNASTKQLLTQKVTDMKGTGMEMADAMPSHATILKQTDLLPRLYNVEGQALLIQKENLRILRLENFKTANGPDMHIYLSTELGDKSFVDLGPMKATKGDVNYEIPLGTDTNKYTKVLIWCNTFSVIFSYAEFQ